MQRLRFICFSNHDFELSVLTCSNISSRAAEKPRVLAQAYCRALILKGNGVLFKKRDKSIPKKLYFVAH